MRTAIAKKARHKRPRNAQSELPNLGLMIFVSWSDHPAVFLRRADNKEYARGWCDAYNFIKDGFTASPLDVAGTATTGDEAGLFDVKIDARYAHERNGGAT